MRAVTTLVIGVLLLTVADTGFAQTSGGGSSVGAVTDGGPRAGTRHRHHPSGTGAYVSRPAVQALPKDQ